MDSGLITEEVHPTQKHKRAHTSEHKRTHTHTHKRSKSTHTQEKMPGAKKKKMGNGKPPAARQLSLKDDRDPQQHGSSEAVGTRNRNGEVLVLVVVRRRMTDERDSCEGSNPKEGEEVEDSSRRSCYLLTP